jgi:hypothetical protein
MRFIKSKAEWKLNENLSTARKILKDMSIPETDETFIKLKNDLKNNTGYLGWLTKMIYINKVSESDINQVIELIKNDKYVIDNLPKNLVNYTKWEDLLDDIISINYNRSVKKIINELPAHLKRNLNVNNLSDNDKNLFTSLYKRKDKDNFISKVSRYRTYKEFEDALKLFLTAGDKNFNDTLNAVNSSGSRVLHSDKSNNIIICEVNYKQIKELGGDTSWCIVPSESTFNDYVKGIYKQYIIFLTDLNTIYSKIGVTAAFKVNNAHLKNDKSIRQDELSKVLSERGYDILNMLFNVNDFLKSNDINKVSVRVLSEDCGLKDSYILDNKEAYTNDDVNQFTPDQIKAFNLNNKLVFKTFHDFEKKFEENKPYFSSDLINNIVRIRFNISTYDIVKMRPSPRELEKLIPIIYDNCLSEIESVISYIGKPKELIENINKFVSYSYVSINYRDEIKREKKDDSKFMIYAMMVAGVYPQTVDKEDIISNIRRSSAYDLFEIIKHLEMNGYEFSAEELYTIFEKIRPISSMFGTIAKEWLRVLVNYPQVAPFVKNIIEAEITKTSFYDSELVTIKKIYPELYEDANFNSQMLFEYADFKRISIYSNYMDSENYVQRAIKKDNLSVNEWLEKLYDKYFGSKEVTTDGEVVTQGVLKKYTKFGNKEVFLIVTILTKLNKLNELSSFDIKWGSNYGYSSEGNPLTYMIRLCYDDYSIKLPINSPELKLSEEEHDEILDTLMKIDYDFADPMTKYEAFAVPYYEKNWGFNIFMRFVKEKEGTEDRKYHSNDGIIIKKLPIIRVSYISELLRYLVLSNRISEAVDLVREIMSWDMTEEERSATVKYLRSSYDLNFSTSNEYTTKWRKTMEEMLPEE